MSLYHPVPADGSTGDTTPGDGATLGITCRKDPEVKGGKAEGELEVAVIGIVELAPLCTFCVIVTVGRTILILIQIKIRGYDSVTGSLCLLCKLANRSIHYDINR